MAALGWLQNLAIGGSASAASAVITGPFADGATEVEVQAAYQTITITLSNDTFKTFTQAIKQAVLDGITSSGSETNGWNNRVRDALTTPYVTRVSSTQARIVIPAFPAYSISANETVTITLPASCVSGGVAITATPTFVISNVGTVGTEISNSGASRSAPNNYLLDDRTGFREHPHDGLHKDGYGAYTRKKSMDYRHPQDSVRSPGGERHKGSVSPEQTDTFLADGEVTADDL